MNNAYLFENNWVSDSIEFISDSLFMRIGHQHKNTYKKNEWLLINFYGKDILLFGEVSAPFLIEYDSITRIGILYLGDNKYHQKFDKITPKENDLSIYGTWIDESEFADIEPPLPPFSENISLPYNILHINKDSITYTNKLLNISVNNGKFSKTKEFLYFRNKYNDYFTIEILKMSNTTLKVKITYPFYSQTFCCPDTLYLRKK